MTEDQFEPGEVSFAVKQMRRIAQLEKQLVDYQAENRKLAAGQCCVSVNGLWSDDGGVIYCRQQAWRERESAEYEANSAAYEATVSHLRQQLSAALAACKQKDEALSKIEYLESGNGSILSAGGCSSVATEALAVQPDDSALNNAMYAVKPSKGVK